MEDDRLKFIREKCIAANPEIGQAVRISPLIVPLPRLKDKARRPIRLADVLLAMNKLHHDGSYMISDAGFFAHFKARCALAEKAIRVFECAWNLGADNLKRQRPETIDFIANLLLDLKFKK